MRAKGRASGGFFAGAVVVLLLGGPTWAAGPNDNSVTLTNPVSGDIWEKGASEVIEWTSTGTGFTPQHYRIVFYLVNTRNNQRTLVEKYSRANPIYNDGIEEVTVPCGLNIKDAYLVEIRAVNIKGSTPTVVTHRSGPITIVPGDKCGSGPVAGDTAQIDVEVAPRELALDSNRTQLAGSFTVTSHEPQPVAVSVEIGPRLQELLALQALEEPSEEEDAVQFLLSPGESRAVFIDWAEEPDPKKVAELKRRAIKGKVYMDAIGVETGKKRTRSVNVFMAPGASGPGSIRGVRAPEGSLIPGPDPRSMLWHGGGLSQGFIGTEPLEDVYVQGLRCGIIGGHSTGQAQVTTNAVTHQSATQMEKQLMIQMRMLACTPQAIAEVEGLIERHKAEIAPEVYARLMNRNTGLLLGEEDTTGAAAAAFFGARVHLGVLNRLFISKSQFATLNKRPTAKRLKGKYDPGNAHYGWIWPTIASRKMLTALSMAFPGGIENPVVQAELPAEVRDYLVGIDNGPAPSRPPKSVRRKEMLVPDSVFFKEPLLSSTDPNAKGIIYTIKMMMKESRQASETVWCLATHQLPFDTGSTPATRPLFDAQCPGLRPLVEIEADELYCRMRMQERGAPQEAFFISRRYVAARYTRNLPALCQNLQRSERAAQKWGTQLLEAGHTPEGLVESWTGMYAHSFLLLDRALSFQPDITRQPEIGGPFLERILALRDAAVPGMSASGGCPLDF